jgi:ATP-dependent HslUV protease ATP-binding subunit HslU
MERLLENISFILPDYNASDLTIDAQYVEKMLGELHQNQDLSRYIL